MNDDKRLSQMEAELKERFREAFDDYLKENGDYMYNAGAGNCAKIKTSADRNADSGGYPERGSCCKPFYPVVVGDHDGTGSEKTDPAYNLCSHA